jgi:hypothetical protein
MLSGPRCYVRANPLPTQRLLAAACTSHWIPARKNFQPIDDETAERIVGDFLPRLLKFRLEHYGEFRPTDADLPLLSPRMRDLMRALVLPFVGTEAVINAVMKAIRDQEQQIIVDRADEPEALVILALFGYCHDNELSTVLVGQIASWINARRKQVGEEATLTARAVGSILKSLGFTTDKLDRFGRGLRLTIAAKRRIHQLVHSYGIVSTSQAITGRCVLCKEMGTHFGESGTS